MRIFGKFVVKVLVAIFVFVCSRAALEVAHTLDWYPERQLANLILAAPSALQIEVVMWSILAFVTAALWLLIDYRVYGRNYAALWSTNRKNNKSKNRPRIATVKKPPLATVNSPPIATVVPGIVWKKRKNQWAADWRASAEAKKLGFQPSTLRVFQGGEITEFDEQWISERAKDMQTEMEEWLRKQNEQTQSINEILAAIGHIIQSDDLDKKT